ncbi:MAG: hypothetical protein P8X74_03600 [Reinekea sp.]
MSIDTPMMFETVRDAIKALLETYQTGRYRVIRGQAQSLSAEEFKGTDRAVQVFYSSGEYPEGANSMQKISAHDCTYTIEYYVSSPCKVDRNVLDDDSLDSSQKQAALSAVQAAFDIADSAMDELRRMVSQVIMSPRYQDIGLDRFKVSNRWLKGFNKSQSVNHGKLVMLTATERLTCRVTETLTGVTPTDAVQPIVSATLEQQPLYGDEITEPPDVGIDTTQ